MLLYSLQPYVADPSVVIFDCFSIFSSLSSHRDCDGILSSAEFKETFYGLRRILFRKKSAAITKAGSVSVSVFSSSSGSANTSSKTLGKTTSSAASVASSSSGQSKGSKSASVVAVAASPPDYTITEQEEALCIESLRNADPYCTDIITFSATVGALNYVMNVPN
jgi:hypothetical protein